MEETRRTLDGFKLFTRCRIGLVLVGYGGTGRPIEEAIDFPLGNLAHKLFALPRTGVVKETLPFDEVLGPFVLITHGNHTFNDLVVLDRIYISLTIQVPLFSILGRYIITSVETNLFRQDFANVIIKAAGASTVDEIFRGLPCRVIMRLPLPLDVELEVVTV